MRCILVILFAAANEGRAAWRGGASDSNLSASDGKPDPTRLHTPMTKAYLDNSNSSASSRRYDPSWPFAQLTMNHLNSSSVDRLETSWPLSLTDSDNTDLSAYRVGPCVGVILLLLSACLIWRGTNSYCASLLAVSSAVAFGVDNFMLGYASVYLHPPVVSTHVSFMFFTLGLIAVISHYSLLNIGTSYRTEWTAAKASSRSTMGYIALTGVFIALAQFTGSISFSMDGTNAGPHQAVVSINTVLVGGFFFLYAGDTFTRLQLCGCAAVILGTAIMAEISDYKLHPASLEAFGWICLSAVFYAASCITLRLASSEDVPERPKLVLILATIGISGVFLFIWDVFEDPHFESFHAAPLKLLWPFLNACASALGMWSVVGAFDIPGANAGVLTAIIDSNSVVMMVMNRVLLFRMPSVQKIAGMLIIVMGCIMLALFGISSDKGEREDIESSKLSPASSLRNVMSMGSPLRNV